jgi:hypothetical protein
MNEMKKPLMNLDKLDDQVVVAPVHIVVSRHLKKKLTQQLQDTAYRCKRRKPQDLGCWDIERHYFIEIENVLKIISTGDI